MANSCSQTIDGAPCSRDAAILVNWPGSAAKPMCAVCTARAAGISSALGFTLSTSPLDRTVGAPVLNPRHPATAAAAAGDTANVCIVARCHDGIVLLHPPAPGQVISDELAINVAAWLVAMIDDGAAKLAATLSAIQRI